MRNVAGHNIGRRAVILIAALLAAAFMAACGGSGGGEGGGGDTTDATVEETTASPSGEERMIEVRRMDSGNTGQGDAEPRAVVAPSFEALSAAPGINPELRRAFRNTETTTAGGEEVYVAVLWGEKNTGGYAVEIEDARVEGERVFVSVARSSPPEGAIVSQAFTYPYAVAALENLAPANREFVLVNGGGRELEWPVEKAGF